MLHFVCLEDENRINNEDSSVYAYLIYRKNIPGNNCRTEMYIQYFDSYSVYDLFRPLTINLIYIPEEFYLFVESF